MISGNIAAEYVFTHMRLQGAMLATDSKHTTAAAKLRSA